MNYFLGLLAGFIAFLVAGYKIYVKPHMASEDNITTIKLDPPVAPVSPQEPSPVRNMIVAWAEAISQGEGASLASNNPGNMKYTTLTASWGASKGRAATDGGFLCQFPTQEQGFTALCNFLTLACEGELIISHPQPCTLRDFTMRYAGNPPEGYLERIAAYLNVPTSVLISTFLT